MTYFRLQKTHFWSDYYNGQLSSYGLHTLNSLCDAAIDTPKNFIDLKTIKTHIVGKSRLRPILNIIRNCTRKWQKYLPWYYSNTQQHQYKTDTNNYQSKTSIHQSQNWYSVLFKKLFHYLLIPFLITLIECMIIIYQLHTNLCNRLSNENLIKLHLTLEILSSILLIFDYIQIYHWFHNNKQQIIRIWIILYSFAITCRLLGCIIYLTIFITTPSKQLCKTFYILKSLSLIECIILCLFLIEPLRLFVDYILNRYVSVSYDIGLAYISSEEQVLRIIHRLTDNGKITVNFHYK